MKSLMTAVFVVLISSIASSMEDDAFFPTGIFFKDNLELDAIPASRISERLKRLEERSLWKLSRAESRAESYRLFWWDSNSTPISIRLGTERGKRLLVVSQNRIDDVKNEAHTGMRRSTEVTEKSWQQAVSLLNSTPFWSAPTSVIESRGIGDGDRIVIEGVKDGKYHVVDRVGLTTSQSYKLFCRYLLELSGSPMIKKWETRRSQEKAHPSYRSNYPETEDRGDPLRKD